MALSDPEDDNFLTDYEVWQREDDYNMSLDWGDDW